MNNTKVAVIFSEKKSHLWYINNHPGLMEALSSLPRNFHVEFFCNTDTMNAFIRDGQTIWFKNTIKAMKWAINTYFEPNIVICVGSPNYEWDKILVGKYRKIFIYDSYEEPTKTFDWDVVIVPTLNDLQFFPKAMVATVFNSRLFSPEEHISKTFQRCFPQQVTNLDLIEKLILDKSTVTMNKLGDVFYLSDIPSYMLSSIFNRSKVVCLLDKTNDMELALSAMACQIPVVTVVDNKSSQLPNIVYSTATTPEIETSISIAERNKVNYNVAPYTIESFIKQIKRVL